MARNGEIMESNAVFFSSALVALISVVAFMAFSLGKALGRKCAIRRAWGANPTIPPYTPAKISRVSRLVSANRQKVHGVTRGEKHGKSSNEEISAKTAEEARTGRA